MQNLGFSFRAYISVDVRSIYMKGVVSVIGRKPPDCVKNPQTTQTNNKTKQSDKTPMISLIIPLMPTVSNTKDLQDFILAVNMINILIR